jgi:hypothetical protein
MDDDKESVVEGIGVNFLISLLFFLRPFSSPLPYIFSVARFYSQVVSILACKIV